MTQPAYTRLIDGIDRQEPQAICIGETRVRVTPVRKATGLVYKIAWGPRGFRQVRETTVADRAKEIVKAACEHKLSRLALAAHIPDAEVMRARMALAELPGVPVEALVAAYKAQMEEQKRKLGRNVPELVASFLQQTEARHRSPRHIQTLRSHLTRFGEAFRTSIAHITTDDVERYLNGFGSPKTRNNHRGSLVALFSFARRQGDLPDNSPTAAERTMASKVVRHEPEVLSLTDLEKLLNACTDPKLRMFLILGAFAGCRSAEIHRLRWRHITDQGIFLPPEVTKTNRRRVVEVPENLAAWLGTVERGEPDDFVSFPHPPQLYASLRALCASSGVNWVDNGLRHGYVSHHLEMFGDVIRTSKNTGHSLRELETDYLKLVTKSDALAWFSLFPKPQPNENNAKSTIQGQTPDNLHGMG